MMICMSTHLTRWHTCNTSVIYMNMSTLSIDRQRRSSRCSWSTLWQQSSSNGGTWRTITMQHGSVIMQRHTGQMYVQTGGTSTYRGSTYLRQRHKRVARVSKWRVQCTMAITWSTCSDLTLNYTNPNSTINNTLYFIMGHNLAKIWPTKISLTCAAIRGQFGGKTIIIIILNGRRKSGEKCY